MLVYFYLEISRLACFRWNIKKDRKDYADIVPFQSRHNPTTQLSLSQAPLEPLGFVRMTATYSAFFSLNL